MSEMGLKTRMLSPVLDPVVFNVGCFHYVAGDCAIFSTLESAPTTNVYPAPLSTLGCLLEEKGVVFTLKKVHTACPLGE